MRSTLLISLFFLGCNQNEAQVQEESPFATAPKETAASSASTRWVAVLPAQDASLLSAPCITRTEPQARGEVSTTFRAQITRVHVQVGDTLSAGAAVADVSAPGVVAAAARYVGLRNRLRVHREHLDALVGLRKEGMVRTAAVFEQRALTAQLSADQRQAASVLRMANVPLKQAGRIADGNPLVLRAPVAGVVASVFSHPGEVVDGSEPIATIIGKAPARIEVRSPAPLVLGTSLTMHGSDGQRHELNATPITSILDAKTGMNKTWFVLRDLSVSLGDGMACTVRWSVQADVWQVPAASVTTTGDGSLLWRLRSGVPEAISVQILNSSGSSVLVRGALADGDSVAADADTYADTRESSS